MIRWYKNSFLASVVSIVGCCAIMYGIFRFVNDQFEEGILFAIVGLVLAFFGKWISENKAFKVWWKQVSNANLIPQIAQDVSAAIAVYNKNPQKRTLKKLQS